MDLHIPNDWIKVEPEQLDLLLAQIDYTRSAYSNGEYYCARGYETFYTVRPPTGPELRPMDRHVALRMERSGRCYVDPEFFKPV